MLSNCDHVGLDVSSLARSFNTHLRYSLAKDEYSASKHDIFMALAFTIRDRMIERWIATQQAYHLNRVKRVYYLSLEYMMGRALLNNVLNLNLFKEVDSAVQQVMNEVKTQHPKIWMRLELANTSLSEILEQEPDAGLGNGGLGRLAACFLDSMATLSIPAMGYGLRYDFGIFRQDVSDNCQVEAPDEWLRYGNPWELERPECTFNVNFGGHVEIIKQQGRDEYVWVPDTTVIGIPFDYPILGYGSDNVNTLRLWSAKANTEFDLSDFNQGDYIAAVRNKIQAETLTKVLYPSDRILTGRQLRFQQQYFFVSCSIQDILRRFKVDHQNDWEFLVDRVAIQLNDTHPAIGIAELMHILVDKNRLTWEKAWDITTKIFGYTNHTLLPEALEKWPVSLFQSLLPRHLQIIYEINRRFLEKVSLEHPGDNQRLGRMSLVEEAPEKQIRMANLAALGSHSINGVAALHTKLLQENLMKDFYEVFPERFNNKTNGITQRRWLLMANPRLSAWITEKIGKGWITNLSELKKLEAYIDNPEEVEKFARIKHQNKEDLAKLILASTGIQNINPHAIFDVQIKRMHEYKRQLLNILHVIMLYKRLKRVPDWDIVPRVFIFGGKAAPSYAMAKLIIKFINCVAYIINNDRSINNKLKVVFLPNYGVTMAERIIPAADVSEQISTAGMEASGTGNMKLSLNGALTIGTLDGANIEIMEEVGPENIFIFGLTTEEVTKLRPVYNPYTYFENDKEIHDVIDLIMSNFFCLHRPGDFEMICNDLLHNDHFMVMADLRAYADCQAKIDTAYRDHLDWHRMSILNVARMGKFSTDRVISQYANEIWNVKPFGIDIRTRTESGNNTGIRRDSDGD